MSLRLRIEHGQDAGTTYRLPGAGVYTLGRVPQNSIRVLDMKVSKTHCELRVSGEGNNLKCMLHDPGSTHGCELNGQPVPKGKDVPMDDRPDHATRDSAPACRVVMISPLHRAAVYCGRIVGLVVAEIKDAGKLPKEDSQILAPTFGRGTKIGYILSLGKLKI